MANVEFSLKQRDKTRYIKDRCARFVVKSGGIGILAAILLIFFYLISIVLPIFFSAEVKPLAQYAYQHNTKVVGIGAGDYGKNAFIFDEQGQLVYIGLEQGEAKTLLAIQVTDNPSSFAKSTQSQGWYAYGNSRGELMTVKPRFNVSFTGETRVLTPDLQVFNNNQPILVDKKRNRIEQFAFTIQNETGMFIAVSDTGEANAVQVRRDKAANESYPIWHQKNISLPKLPEQIDQIKISPDGKQLFVLSGSELMIAILNKDQFIVREFVDLSRGDAESRPKKIYLLSGVHSILVMHENDRVTQWFDVLKSGERKLVEIRAFSLGQGSQFLLTDTYRKGFYNFQRDGSMQSFYSTSENQLFSGQIYSQLPDVVAISDNENYLIALNNNTLVAHELKNAHPEVTFSSLWKKVWYESYPEPQYVWQSTSASDDFEAKFSLVPIAFGTLKATFFTMLFSVPLAVSGAIYTAYFMSSSMRRVVKPSIEIMEALPTVIIGFLAGLWLAPIIETYLTGVVVLIFILPISAILMSVLWALLPKKMMKQLPNGWHVVVLIPVILVLANVSMTYSADIEHWLFNGDIRVFLAEHGINYDQRNALIVGLAMGFAVIPNIFTIAEDAIFSVPRHLSDGSLALGATQWQTLLYVVLLTASPGIFSAIMIGLGRAVGETMIILMATGNTPIMDFNIFEGMRSLSATIAVETPESEVGDTHYRVLFLAALVLFIFTFIVNSLAEIVRQRLKDKYSSM